MGATDLLSASRGEVFVADMSQPTEELAVLVEDLISHRTERLAVVGRAAAQRARSWTETANGRQLVSLLQKSLEAHVVPMCTIEAGTAQQALQGEPIA